MAKSLEFVLKEMEAVSDTLGVPSTTLTRTQLLESSACLSYNDLRMNGGIGYIRVLLAQRSARPEGTATSVISVEGTLPPPEELPAPYAKRVYDMWVSLTGDRSSIFRVA